MRRHERVSIQRISVIGAAIDVSGTLNLNLSFSGGIRGGWDIKRETVHGPDRKICNEQLRLLQSVLCILRNTGLKWHWRALTRFQTSAVLKESHSEDNPSKDVV